ncbi:MAG: type II toxin-antitoxin system RelE/ParE family toxin [Gammaproteobacteria bacterium]
MVTIKLSINFFRTEQQAEPVKAWLKKLSTEEKLIIGTDLKTIQFSWPIGMPLVKHVGNGMWEARSSLPQGKISRILFVIYNNTIVLLHGFIKKSQKIPAKELDLAKKRKQQLEASK